MFTLEEATGRIRQEGSQLQDRDMMMTMILPFIKSCLRSTWVLLGIVTNQVQSPLILCLVTWHAIRSTEYQLLRDIQPLDNLSVIEKHDPEIHFWNYLE
jgi:hypothetical protein